MWATTLGLSSLTCFVSVHWQWLGTSEWDEALHPEKLPPGVWVPSPQFASPQTSVHLSFLTCKMGPSVPSLGAVVRVD